MALWFGVVGIDLDLDECLVLEGKWETLAPPKPIQIAKREADFHWDRGPR